RPSRRTASSSRLSTSPKTSWRPRPRRSRRWRRSSTPRVERPAPDAGFRRWLTGNRPAGIHPDQETTLGIEFRHVGKTYPDGTVAVADFSHAVPSHRTVALVGSSGSGKTTLLRMVNRMIDPTHGTVLIDDQDIRELDKVELR